MNNIYLQCITKIPLIDDKINHNICIIGTTSMYTCSAGTKFIIDVLGAVTPGPWLLLSPMKDGIPFFGRPCCFLFKKNIYMYILLILLILFQLSATW